jgi:hypothetical protein
MKRPLPAIIIVLVHIKIVLLHINPAAASNLRVAVLPPRESLGPAASTRIESALVEALQATPSFSVANLSNGKLTAPHKLGLESQPGARALALGREVNAQRAVAVEATPLGDGLVVYLQALEVPGGRALGSTTVSLGGGAGGGDARASDREALRAGLVRILDPARYVGRVALKLDVQGAQLEVDGKPVSFGTIELPVGTHALRGTHPAYHDFLRFLDVEFGKTINVDVNMAMYPLAEGEMTERARRGLAPPPRRKIPWWRSWWALSLSGAIITGATVGAVFVTRPGIISDTTTPYKPIPTH